MTAEEQQRADAVAEWRRRWAEQLVDGRTWLEQSSPTIQPIWGEAGGTVWAPELQPTLVAAFSGIGKTTICQRLALGRIGVPGFETLLGYPVHPFPDDTARALYLASDRPDQARLSMRRFITSEEALEIVSRRLVIWQGPPPLAVSNRPSLLAEMADEAGARLVVPDSLKDMANKLSDDETGAAINSAHQQCVAAGVDVIAPHHPRKKSNNDGDERRPTIDDLFGSAWIGNGAGSVLFLIREPRSVELLQVKSPLGEEGASIRFQHDTKTGTLTVGERDPVVAAVYDAGPAGITTPGVAKWVHDGTEPSDAQIEQVRRRLRQLESLGIVNQRPAGRNKKQGATWVHHEH